MTFDKSSPKRVTIWRFIDGKPGHEKQSLGLVLALAKLQNVNCHEIKVGDSGLKNFFDYCFARFKEGINLPKPDLLIGAGHRTHLPMLAAKRVFGGKSIVLMKPSLPYSFFDMCLIPMHDNPPRRANILPTIGALNSLGLDGQHPKAPSSHLILIGGPSPHYIWDNQNIITQIVQLVTNKPSCTEHWTLTTSPRTPESFLEELEKKKIPNIKVHKFEDTKNGWVEQKLLTSENAWVTPDSVSMTYEALSAGCRTGVLELSPHITNSRISRSIQTLLRDGYILPQRDYMIGEITNTKFFAPQAPLCAQMILKDAWI
jgi:mitochondrial fission protein ELM1